MTDYLHKVAITGGNGQLANAIRNHPLAQSMQIHTFSRLEMDITDANSIAHIIAQFQPSIIINTAAYTAVDKAENETDLCLKINYAGTKKLAIACKKAQIPLIHLSSDYIFDGIKNGPYLEEDKPNPSNQYGKSKWLSEQVIREECQKHLILRVSGVFSEFGNNFLKTITRLAHEKKQLKVVSDQITCPTYAGDIANTLLTITKQYATDDLPWGTYHFCSKLPTSWYQFAIAIIAHLKKIKPVAVEEITPISTAAYQAAANRPANSVLNCDRIYKNFGIVQPDWRLGMINAINYLYS